MTRVDELIREAEQLDPEQRVRLLQRLFHLVLPENVPVPGISRNPAVCGGDACIARTRIPVWVLDQMRRLGRSEADILRSYPALNAGNLVDAWNYVRENPDEIDRLIRENAA